MSTKGVKKNVFTESRLSERTKSNLVSLLRLFLTTNPTAQLMLRGQKADTARVGKKAPPLTKHQNGPSVILNNAFVMAILNNNGYKIIILQSLF